MKIKVTRRFIRVLPTDHGNVLVGKPFKVTFSVKSMSEYYKLIDKFLDDGVYVELE